MILIASVWVFSTQQQHGKKKPYWDILQNSQMFKEQVEKIKHTYTQNDYASSILLILSSQMQWHSISLFIYHSRDWSISMNKRKLDSVISASLKTDSKPMDRDVAEEFSAETVHNSFTAQFMSKWLTTEKDSGHNWGIQRYIFWFLLQGWFTNLKNVQFYFIYFFTYSIGRFLT